jgi:hypothetical protein
MPLLPNSMKAALLLTFRATPPLFLPLETTRRRALMIPISAPVGADQIGGKNNGAAKFSFVERRCCPCYVLRN